MSVSSRAGIRSVRLVARLTQKDIVTHMRSRGSLLTQTSLSLIESGLREATPQTIEKIKESIQLILTERLSSVQQLLGTSSPLRNVATP